MCLNAVEGKPMFMLIHPEREFLFEGELDVEATS